MSARPTEILGTTTSRGRGPEHANAGRLQAHLEASYRIRIARICELDAGVFRIDQREGPSWVARVFPATRPAGSAAGDAAILRFLESQGYAAERCAAAEPVSVLGRQDVLVTGYIVGAERSRRVETIRRLGGFIRLGAMLGRLHTLPAAGNAVTRPGGAWHHLTEGSPRDEIAAAARLLDDAADQLPAAERTAFDALREEVARFDGGDGLPEALIHPDFVLANVVASPDHGYALVDWTGAGIGPRLWSLAFLLFSAGARGLERVDSAVAGYLRHIRPEPEELRRLPPVIRVRPAIFELWALGQGRKSLAEAMRGMAESRELADAVAARAQEAFRAHRGGAPA